MLTSVRLRNYRAFQDTGLVKLSRLNIFIGANNAGKTSLTSAIELMLRSMRGGGQRGPLAFGEMSAFASFDAILRKHWGPNKQRPKNLELCYTLGDKRKNNIEVNYVCRGNSGDGTTEVLRIEYKIGKYSATIELDESESEGVKFHFVGNDQGKSDSTNLFFHGLVPLPMDRGKEARKFRELTSKLFESDIADGPYRLEVVHPSRPVPRSFYVVDDPGLTLEDRNLLTFLIRIWSSSEKEDKEVKERIVENMSALGLTKDFSLSLISKRMGPKVFEIRVSPTNKRQTVTIADAGFGLSQVLPLIAYEARLTNGYLVAYQPELHLHPRAQARLADIFVRSVGRGNQVFAETHSPDLILRLQLLIVEGKISPNDISVFCLENGTGKAQIKEIEFSESGVPNSSWPEGFLDTSLSLARELNAARLIKSSPK